MTYKRVSRESVTKRRAPRAEVAAPLSDRSIARGQIPYEEDLDLVTDVTNSDDDSPQKPKGPTSRRYDLPTRLELATKLSIREMIKILRVPLDPKDGNMLRAKINSAGITLNAQLRADEARLKAKVHTDTLSRLLKIVEQQKMQLLDDTK